ncbi:MAG: UbiA family prenyltransferase [Planctomycetota bacterium]
MAGERALSSRELPLARALYKVGRFHIVAIAALAALTFGWAFTGRYLWWAPAICALDWFLVNLLNRVVDLREDAANGIEGTDFAARHQGAIRALFALGLATSVVATHALAPALTPWRLGYHALGLAYNVRLLPGRRRLKELYLLKNAASDVGMLLTCFGYPLALGGGLEALRPDLGLGGLLCFALFFFLFELSYEVVYDLRDVAGDSAEGVRTFAVVHGPEGAGRIASGLMLASLVVAAGGAAGGALPARLACMAAAPLAQLVLVRRWLARGVDKRDCVRLTWLGAGLLVLYHGWVALGLPGA